MRVSDIVARDRRLHGACRHAGRTRLDEPVEPAARLRDEHEINRDGIEIEGDRAFEGEDRRRRPVVRIRAPRAHDPFAVVSSAVFCGGRDNRDGRRSHQRCSRYGCRRRGHRVCEDERGVPEQLVFLGHAARLPMQKEPAAALRSVLRESRIRAVRARRMWGLPSSDQGASWRPAGQTENLVRFS